jgi:hypothetical protein
MKMDVCRKEGNILKIRLISETYEDISLLYDVGQRCKKPINSLGGFSDMNVWLWINVPLRVGYKWGFNNDLQK